MKLKLVYCFGLILGIVLFSYGTSNAQVVDAVEKAAEKTAEVSKDIARETKEATVKGAKKTVKGVKKAYDVGDDIAADTAEVSKKGAKKTYNTGEYITVTAWDGTKWVSKKVKKGTLKGVEKTEDGIEIIGEEAADIVD